MRDPRRAVVRVGYDRVAERYLGDRPTNGADVGLLHEFVDRVGSGHTVLDAGCGAGVPVADHLIEAGLDVVGLDFAFTQLRLARSHVPRAVLTQGDLAALPFDDRSFEGVVSYYAVIHVPRADHRTVMAEFRRVLRPSGTALLCLGANDNPADEDPEGWLGAPMFWSHFDAATTVTSCATRVFESCGTESFPIPWATLVTCSSLRRAAEGCTPTPLGGSGGRRAGPRPR